MNQPKYDVALKLCRPPQHLTVQEAILLLNALETGDGGAFHVIETPVGDYGCTAIGYVSEKAAMELEGYYDDEKDAVQKAVCDCVSEFADDGHEYPDGITTALGSVIIYILT